MQKEREQIAPKSRLDPKRIRKAIKRGEEWGRDFAKQQEKVRQIGPEDWDLIYNQ